MLSKNRLLVYEGPMKHMYIYWLNYCRQLRREEGGENSLNPLAPAIGLGAEIANHRGNSTVPCFQHRPQR